MNLLLKQCSTWDADPGSKDLRCDANHELSVSLSEHIEIEVCYPLEHGHSMGLDADIHKRRDFGYGTSINETVGSKEPVLFKASL